MHTIYASPHGNKVRQMDNIICKRLIIRSSVSEEELEVNGLRDIYGYFRCNHAHILRATSIKFRVKNNALYAYIMMPSGGMSLWDWRLTTQYSTAQVIIPRIIYQVASALDYMQHIGPGLIHGDLKPGNIVITPNLHVKIIDWGALRIYPGEKTWCRCTPGAASQEYRVHNICLSAGDIFALGSAVYTLVYKTVLSQSDINRGDRIMIPTICYDKPLTDMVNRMLSHDMMERPHPREIMDMTSKYCVGYEWFQAKPQPDEAVYINRFVNITDKIHVMYYARTDSLCKAGYDDIIQYICKQYESSVGEVTLLTAITATYIAVIIIDDDAVTSVYTIEYVITTIVDEMFGRIKWSQIIDHVMKVIAAMAR